MPIEEIQVTEEAVVNAPVGPREIAAVTDDGCNIKIYKEENRPTEQLRVQMTREETKEVSLYNGTLTDLTSEINRISQEITRLTAEKEKKEALFTTLSAEVQKAVAEK